MLVCPLWSGSHQTSTVPNCEPCGFPCARQRVFGDFGRMRVSRGFSPNRAQAESFAGVVAGMAHPSIVEGKNFRPSPLKKQFAIVRAFGGVAEDRECAVPVNHRFKWPKAVGISVHARPLPLEGTVRC